MFKIKFERLRKSLGLKLMRFNPTKVLFGKCDLAIQVASAEKFQQIHTANSVSR